MMAPPPPFDAAVHHQALSPIFMVLRWIKAPPLLCAQGFPAFLNVDGHITGAPWPRVAVGSAQNTWRSRCPLRADAVLHKVGSRCSSNTCVLRLLMVHYAGPAINHFQQVEARGAIFWCAPQHRVSRCAAAPADGMQHLLKACTSACWKPHLIG